MTFELRSLAQVQRAALEGPQDIVLSPKGSTGSEKTPKAICLDKNLPAPYDQSRYRNLLLGVENANVDNGGTRMSLQKALDDGIVELRGLSELESREWHENDPNGNYWGGLPVVFSNLTAFSFLFAMQLTV